LGVIFVLLTAWFLAPREDFFGSEAQLAIASMVTSQFGLGQIWQKNLLAKKWSTDIRI
jgi:hypothetical protein